MAEQIFADDLMAISIHDGAVRMDFVTYVPGQKEGEMQPVFRKRLVLSLPDFVRSYTRLRDAVDGLVEQGVLVRAPGPEGMHDAGGAASAEGEGPSADVSPPGVSTPNFSRE